MQALKSHWFCKFIKVFLRTTLVDLVQNTVNVSDSHFLVLPQHRETHRPLQTMLSASSPWPEHEVLYILWWLCSSVGSCINESIIMTIQVNKKPHNIKGKTHRKRAQFLFFFLSSSVFIILRELLSKYFFFPCFCTFQVCTWENDMVS